MKHVFLNFDNSWKKNFSTNLKFLSVRHGQLESPSIYFNNQQGLIIYFTFIFGLILITIIMLKCKVLNVFNICYFFMKFNVDVHSINKNNTRKISYL